MYFSELVQQEAQLEVGRHLYEMPDFRVFSLFK